MNPPCLHCGHKYESHATTGYATGAFYCRQCQCKAYVKKAEK